MGFLPGSDSGELTHQVSDPKEIDSHGVSHTGKIDSPGLSDPEEIDSPWYEAPASHVLVNLL